MGRFVSGENTFDSGNNGTTVNFVDVLNKPNTLAGYGIIDGAVAGNIPFTSLVNRPTTLAGYGITDALAVDGGGTITSFPYSGLTGKPTTLAGYGITDGAVAGNISFNSLTNRPTTLAGYGITDGAVASNISFNSLVSKPTTLAGYGITNALTNTYVPTWGSITGKPTTLAGYGITDAPTVSTANVLASLANQDISCNSVTAAGYINTANLASSGDITASGSISAGAGGIYSTGDITAYSDERLKKDWLPLEDDFVQKLSEVKSGKFTRIDTGANQVGVSAQSLQTLLPEAVKDGEYLSVAYGNAAMVAVVELAKEVVMLKKMIADLLSNKQ